MLPIASIAPGVKLDSVSFTDKIVYSLAKHANMHPGSQEDRKLAKKLEKQIRQLLSGEHVIPYYARSRFFSALSSDFYEPLKPVAKQIIDQANSDVIFERITQLYNNHFSPDLPYWTLCTAIGNGFTVKQLEQLKPSSVDCITKECWSTLVRTAVDTNQTNTLDFLKQTNPHLQWKEMLCTAIEKSSQPCIDHVLLKYTPHSGDAADLLQLSVQYGRQQVVDWILPHYTPAPEDMFEILKVSIKKQNHKVFAHLFDNAQETDVLEMLQKVNTWKEKWSLSCVDEVVARRQKEKINQEVNRMGCSTHSTATVRKM